MFRKTENSQINLRKSHLEVFCQKVVLKIFAKFTEKHLCGNFFFKLQAGNLKLSETATGYVQ